GQAVDATSVLFCDWEPETERATILAEYVDPQAGGPAGASSQGTAYMISDPLFAATLLAGQPWVDHRSAPALPGEDLARPSSVSGDSAVLVVPFNIRGRVAGFAELRDGQHGRQFISQEIALCQTIAQVAAVAIENARLREQLQQQPTSEGGEKSASPSAREALEDQVTARTAGLARANAELRRRMRESELAKARVIQRNRELLSLQSAAAAATGCLDLRFTLETVTWEMSNLLDIEGCVIHEWDEEADTLLAIAAYDAGGREDRLTGQTHHVADYPLRGQVLAERHTQQMTIGQPEVDSAELARMQKGGIKTFLILPMVFQDRVLGLAEMWDSGVERIFTGHEISLAQFLITQAAIAVENARLYERAQQEIAERARVEEQVKASLKEKEVLLREIHHRVKNNLQVVSSLLSLQSRIVDNPAVLEVLNESQNRIRSMALIHERLYRSEDLAWVDFGVYIRDLATFLIRSYRSHPGPIDLKIEAEGVFLNMDVAIPCGLITNELVSNALKHAFPHGKGGQIHIEIKPQDDRQFTMIVGDDGVGFPAHVDFRNTESLGLQLVNTLVQQLDGTVELRCDGGTEFTIRFSNP
ncbi:MAG: histidine kinase dimerization/phosphoacceptor domain -containing protein, partial [Anaerolineae bacterium]